MEDAASPLVVLTTFVLIAVGVASLVVWAVVDANTESIQFQEQEDRFIVVSVDGGLAWSELTVRFLDRAGNDHADWLQVPSGEIKEDQAIVLVSTPPGGTYLLQVLKGGTELARLSYTV